MSLLGRVLARVRSSEDRSRCGVVGFGCRRSSVRLGLLGTIARDCTAGTSLVISSLYSTNLATQFYERSWPQMLHAVATLLKANNIHMLRAVDGLDTQVNEQAPLIASTREAPALFFWVLFGLSFEALCATPPPSGSTSIAAVQEIALESVVGLIRPEVSGTTLLERSLFEELCNLCYRLAITEGPTIKVHVMHIALQLATTFNKELIKKGAVDGWVLGFLQDVLVLTPFVRSASIKSDDIMTQCLRVATCVLSEAVPSSSSPSSRGGFSRHPLEPRLT